MLNKVELIGRLTKDPDVRTISSGSTVASFTLAVERDFKDRNGERGTDFIPVVCWEKTAELVSKYLSKGIQCSVVGRNQTRSYEAKDGTRRFVMEVVGESVYFIGNRAEKNEALEGYNTDQIFFDEDEEAPF